MVLINSPRWEYGIIMPMVDELRRRETKIVNTFVKPCQRNGIQKKERAYKR